MGVRLSAPAASNLFATDFTLREDSLRTDRLCGRIVIRGFLPGARLFIDNVQSDITIARMAGACLHAGEHMVTLLDTSGRIIRNERIRLLPFQTKVVDNPFEKEQHP
jgi:hypothetical protein